ncbi:MAG: hypothetical protein ACKODX_22510, partial [Gemmata sp.]
YKPDVTRVRISARYDPDNGHTLFAAPAVVTFDGKPFGSPVWNEKDNVAPTGPGGRPTGGFGGLGMPAAGTPAGGGATVPPAVVPAPFPLGGSGTTQPPAGAIPLAGPQPGAPVMPPTGRVAPMPGGATGTTVPAGAMQMPGAGAPDGLPPIGFVLPAPQRQ